MKNLETKTLLNQTREELSDAEQTHLSQHSQHSHHSQHNATPQQHNYKITLAYNGAPFAGFARQPKQLTVQGNIEEALTLMLKQDIETVCAGRTDAGVHACGQVVNFLTNIDIFTQREPHSFLRSLNALTHDDISCALVEEVPTDFSARFSAKAREYRYFIHTGPTPSLFLNNFSWHIPHALNVCAMEEASRALIGEHDFKSFCYAQSAIDKPTHRNVSEISFATECILEEEFLVIKVVGNAFLHSMVRTIVGSLVMVGREKRPPLWIEEVLQAKDRQSAGETAPAQGLVFWRVLY